MSRAALNNSKGFTLIELLMVVSIIGVLMSVAAPMYQEYVIRANLVETALELGQWGREFRRWNANNGRYPDDSHIVLPPEAANELIIDNTRWLADTALGGNWNWEGPDNYPYAAISIFGATAPVEEIRQLDFILDNGDLATGIFRQTPNGRYTYILEE